MFATTRYANPRFLYLLTNVCASPRRQETVCEVGESDEQRRWHPKFTVEVDINQCHFAEFRINSRLFTTRTGASLHVYTLGKSGASEYFIGRPSVAAMLFPLTLMITKTRQKKLSCRRRAAQCFMSLNISLSHSRSFKVIRNDAEYTACVSTAPTPLATGVSSSL